MQGVNFPVSFFSPLKNKAINVSIIEKFKYPEKKTNESAYNLIPQRKLLFQSLPSPIFLCRYILNFYAYLNMLDVFFY